MKTTARCPVVVLLALTLAPLSAAAQDGVAARGWAVSGFAMVEPVPVAVMLQPGIQYGWVYHEDQNPLFDRASVTVRAEVWATPVSPGLTLGVSWVPLAPVVVEASWTTFVFTGLQLGGGPGLAFSSASAPFDAQTVLARKGQEESALAHRPAIGLTLRARFSRVRLLNLTQLEGWYVSAGSATGEFWYELMSGLLVARGRVDAGLLNRSVVLLSVLERSGESVLLVGAINQYNRTFAAGLTRDRLGAMAIFEPARLVELGLPTVMVMGGVTLAHPSRQNELWLQVALSGQWSL